MQKDAQDRTAGSSGPIDSLDRWGNRGTDSPGALPALPSEIREAA